MITIGTTAASMPNATNTYSNKPAMLAMITKVGINPRSGSGAD